MNWFHQQNQKEPLQQSQYTDQAIRWTILDSNTNSVWNFDLLQCWLWGLPSLLFSGYHRLFFWG